MSIFRHPKTHNERKADQKLLERDLVDDATVKARIRSGKSGKALPTERDDVTPAAQKERARGKASHSKHRKSKEKQRERLFD